MHNKNVLAFPPSSEPYPLEPMPWHVRALSHILAVLVRYASRSARTAETFYGPTPLTTKHDVFPQYSILREKGTEPAGSGLYNKAKDEGVYRCAGCDTPLYTSETKFDSGCGWYASNPPI